MRPPGVDIDADAVRVTTIRRSGLRVREPGYVCRSSALNTAVSGFAASGRA
jgi:hypothetical protein